MADARENHTLRLYDLKPSEVIIVRCSCGWTMQYPHGYLQRKHRVPSDILVYDLQFRLRCKHCQNWRGFTIIVRDTALKDRSSETANPDRVIVGK